MDIEVFPCPSYCKQCYNEHWDTCVSFNFDFFMFSLSLISMCLGVFLLRFILYGTLCASWTWLTISFSMLGKFSTIISSKFFSYPFFFSSSSGTPIIWMLVHLILSQRSLRLSCFRYSAIYSYLSILISVILLFVSVCLFFNSSRSLLIDSCIFSILFSRYLIIFTVIILNYF